MKIWLTQSAGALRELEPALRRRGYEVYRRPLIATRSASGEDLLTALATLRDCRWLLFTSPAAVTAFSSAGAMPSGDVLIGAVGAGTATALQAAGMTPEIVAQGDAASLAATFLTHPLAGGGVGWPSGDRALKTLPAALEAGGHKVVTATVYRTVTLDNPGSRRLCTDLDVVFVASPSAAEALPDGLFKATVVAIGNTTAAALRARGKDCVQAGMPTVASIVACIEGDVVSSGLIGGHGSG